MKAKPTIDKATLDLLEQATGHRFKDTVRLNRALTHASARGNGERDYERMEFLGDRVLGLCIAEMLFAEFPDAKEGELSVRLNALVNADTLAEVADEIGLHEHIRIGSDVGDVRAARQKNTRADVVESLIAALYLEAGLDAARPFIRRHWAERARHAEAARRDAKTELQEWTHKKFAATPVYTLDSRDGPDHEPVFTVSVQVPKLPPETAKGRSKRIAEQMAAEQMLFREKVWPGKKAGK